ncbi:MAG: hypothetical protein Q9180_003061, partial [Flavoplaca navasiana]
FSLKRDNHTIEVAQDKLEQILDRRERSPTTISRLGENAVGDLAASRAASRLEYWTEEQYEEEYDEDYAGEGDEEFYEEYYEGDEEGQEGFNGASGKGKEDAVEIPADRAPTPVQDTPDPTPPVLSVGEALSLPQFRRWANWRQETVLERVLGNEEGTNPQPEQVMEG